MPFALIPEISTACEPAAHRADSLVPNVTNPVTFSQGTDLDLAHSRRILDSFTECQGCLTLSLSLPGEWAAEGFLLTLCFFFPYSVSSGIKGICLLLARQGKHSDNFHSDNCTEHNQSLSHIFSFGLQCLFFLLPSPYQLSHFRYFICRYLPSPILQWLQPSTGFCSICHLPLSVIYFTCLSSHFSFQPFTKANPKITAPKRIYSCLEANQRGL